VQSATIDTLVEGVAVFGPDGKLKLHNSTFASIWGLSEEELKASRMCAPLLRFALTGSATPDVGPADSEHRLGRGSPPGFGRSGARRPHNPVASLSPLPDGATLVTFADVTDRFRMETALRDRNDALEASDRLKSDFIKHVSYELRTPLNTILGFAEHLASEVPGGLNERQVEYMQTIVSSSNTLKDLVNDILDLALVESGALRLELERIDLYGLLADVANHAGEWAAKMNLTLELDCAPGAGIFLGDPRRMRQIVFNLLSNAFKFTPRGGRIILSGRIVAEDVQIAVADNGPGLAPDVKVNVFERFSARNQSGQRAGAGLGLALVNRFLELHNGWVEIESDIHAKEGGTLVRCHVPRRLHAGDTHDEAGEKVAFL